MGIELSNTKVLRLSSWCRVMKNLFKILVIFLILFSSNLFGSKYYWNNKFGEGSKYYWNNKFGEGSKYHWENGVGITFPDNPWIDIWIGLISSGEDEPDICSTYPFVYEMVKSLK